MHEPPDDRVRDAADHAPLARSSVAALPSDRRRQLTISYAIIAGCTGWMSTAVHLSTGASQRALFTAVFGSLFGLIVVGLRARPNASDLAAHSLLALSTVGLVLSPTTSGEGVPIFLGLIAVPFAATLIIGYRGGLTWTAICVSILLTSAVVMPLSQATKPLAWNTAIIALLIGAASARMDYARERAQSTAEHAREVAERESTSRSRAETRLQQREALLANIFRRTPAILILYDLESSSIVEINDQGSRIIGLDREEAIGQSLKGLDIWTNPEDAERLFAKIRSDDIPKTIETRIQTRRGQSIDLLATVESIEIDDRAHVLINALDVSEQKRARERDWTDLRRTVEDQSAALEVSRSQLQRQHRLASIGTLAAGIAHEINNPVGAIRTIAEVELASLEEFVPPTAPIYASLAHMIEEADRCGEIVRGVLQFSRDEPMSKWAGDLNEAVIRSCNNIRPSLARLRDPDLELSLTKASLPVMMSPIGIDQILSNLLRNAQESADRVLIRVETAREGEFAILRIKDNGRGMDEAVARRAFDPFFTTRLGLDGTGLGLSIVHGLAQDHGATVTLDSSIGRGTTVRLQFPLFETIDANRAPTTAPSPDRPYTV